MTMKMKTKSQSVRRSPLLGLTETKVARDHLTASQMFLCGPDDEVNGLGSSSVLDTHDKLQ